MTTLAPSPTPHRTTSTQACPALIVRWEISPDALAHSPACTKMLNGQGACGDGRGLAKAWLEWCVAQHARAALVLEHADRTIDRVPLESAVCQPDQHEACGFGNSGAVVRHVESAHLKLSLVMNPAGRVDVLYAWTDVLGDLLGLRGGVYDAPQVASLARA